jgi:hypothetical protein
MEELILKRYTYTNDNINYQEKTYTELKLNDIFPCGLYIDKTTQAEDN